MADNHDRVRRFEVAEDYKGRAMEFICEALSVYLEWKQDNPANGRPTEFVVSDPYEHW
jgi:hypothetical protein